MKTKLKGEEFVGKTIRWRSQAQGNFKEKEGVVIEFVPPNEEIQFDFGDTPHSKMKFAYLTSQRTRLLVRTGDGWYYTPILKQDGSFSAELLGVWEKVVEINLPDIHWEMKGLSPKDKMVKADVIARTFLKKLRNGLPDKFQEEHVEKEQRETLAKLMEDMEFSLTWEDVKKAYEESSEEEIQNVEDHLEAELCGQIKGIYKWAELNQICLK